MVQAYFEREDVGVAQDNATIYDRMKRHEADLSSPPPEIIDFKAMLTDMKVHTEGSDFSREENRVINELLKDEMEQKVLTFIKLSWFHAFLALEEQVVEHPEEVVLDMTRCDFTTAGGKLHEFLISREFVQYVCSLCDNSPCPAAQRSIGVQIATATNLELLKHLQRISCKEHEEVINFDVHTMSATGRANVRHVGGWAVRKVLEKSRKYVRKNINTENVETLNSVKNHHRMCELVDESLVAPFAKL